MVILQILVVSTDLGSLFSISYFKHLVETYVLLTCMTYDLPTSMKNKSMTTFKRKKVITSVMVIVKAPLKRKGSPSIPIEVLSVPITSDTILQPMDLDVLLVPSLTPHTFKNLQKFRV